MGTLPETALVVRPSRAGRQLRVGVRSGRRPTLGLHYLGQTGLVPGATNRHTEPVERFVQQADNENADSQASLLAAHSGRLYRTAFAVLRNREDAEDAVQEGLCKAFAKLATFEGRSSLATWLTTIVKNVALMAVRRKRCRPESSLDELLENRSEKLTNAVVDAGPDPEQICAAGEIGARLEAQLRKLSPILRSAFRLRASNNLSVAESSRALGISPGALKSRLSRARRKLALGFQRSLVSTQG
jgi:RNA polymerase sigma-70 factor (ECF subfamily)